MCGSEDAGGGALGWVHRMGEVGLLKTSPTGIARWCDRSVASGFLVVRAQGRCRGVSKAVVGIGREFGSGGRLFVLHWCGSVGIWVCEERG
jgi:hypothetical protein